MKLQKLTLYILEQVMDHVLLCLQGGIRLCVSSLLHVFYIFSVQYVN